jgi:hypothetical protein
MAEALALEEKGKWLAAGPVWQRAVKLNKTSGLTHLKSALRSALVFA